MAFAENKLSHHEMNIPLSEEGMITDLRHILSYKRRHGTQSHDEFVEKFVLSIPGAWVLRDTAKETALKCEVPLAVVVEVGSGSRTMFSSHCDTVHHTSGRQVVKYDEDTKMIWIEGEECLGADDGAGIWIMRQMIAHGVPGTYLFHMGEECGGIGSTGIATHHEDFLARFDRAVAFDRAGRCDVITHQGWGRCCSDEFATALAGSLNEYGLSMEPDNTGVFTDTANYVEDIPECTNLSVGYDRQHTKHETLDVEFLIDLRRAVLCIDWESLPTKRTPAPAYSENRWSGYADDFSYGSKKGGALAYFDARDEVELIKAMGFTATKKWVTQNSTEDIAEVLMELVDQLIYTEERVYELEADLETYGGTSEH